MLVNAVVSLGILNKDYIMLHKVLTRKDVFAMVQRCLEEEGLIVKGTVSDSIGIADSNYTDDSIVLSVTLKPNMSKTSHNALQFSRGTDNISRVSDITNMGSRI